MFSYFIKTFIILSFFVLLFSVKCSSEDDVSKYFWPCSEKREYIYQGYKEGLEIYKRKIVISNCTCKDGVCEEIVDDMLYQPSIGNPSKNRTKYIIRKNEIKKVLNENNKETKYEILLKSPIQVGNRWKNIEIILSSDNNQKKQIFDDSMCEITEIYNSRTWLEPRKCIHVLCDKLTYTFCEGDGLDIINFGEHKVESISEIHYEPSFR